LVNDEPERFGKTNGMA